MRPFLLAVSILGLLPHAQVQDTDAPYALGMMNQARQQQGLQPLSWDTNLAAYARIWADAMASGQVPFGHASGAYRPAQGENIFEQQSTQCSAAYDSPLQAAAQAWLAESSGYVGQPVATGSEPWLHWSQCLWSTSIYVGCAHAYSIAEPYKIYDVCRFYPEGNM